MPSVNMGVEHFADFVFLHNVKNAKIELSLANIRSNKDLFYFCLDLFCKGLVMTFGDGNNRIDMDELDIEKFGRVRAKMLLAGIDTMLTVSPCAVEPAPASNAYLNLEDIEGRGDSDPLPQYAFRLRNHRVVFTIHFEIRSV